MKRFEYRVTKHAAKNLQPLIYFCSEQGECGLDDISGDATVYLQELLNEEGREGWEVVHLGFGTGGLVAVWKREAKQSENDYLSTQKGL